MNFTFTFNSRDSYLSERARWKAEYLSTCDKIRTLKQGVRDVHRAYAQKPTTIGDVWGALWALRDARTEARELLTRLGLAKIEAGRQMDLK